MFFDLEVHHLPALERRWPESIMTDCQSIFILQRGKIRNKEIFLMLSRGLERLLSGWDH